jgi:hypothetical protein
MARPYDEHASRASRSSLLVIAQSRSLNSKEGLPALVKVQRTDTVGKCLTSSTPGCTGMAARTV